MSTTSTKYHYYLRPTGKLIRHNTFTGNSAMWDIRFQYMTAYMTLVVEESNVPDTLWLLTVPGRYNYAENF